MQWTRWAQQWIGVVALVLAMVAGWAGAAMAQPAPTVPASPMLQSPTLQSSSPLQSLLRVLFPNVGSRERWLPLVVHEAERAGVPAELADAVVSATSGYVAVGTGPTGEVGLMRIRPWAAMRHGYRGKVEELADPVVNLRYGLAHLAAAHRLAQGDLCRTLLKYAWNFGEERHTPESLAFCGKVHGHLAQLGSPLAREPLPTLASRPATRAPTAVRVIPVPEPKRAVAVAPKPKPSQTAATKTAAPKTAVAEKPSQTAVAAKPTPKSAPKAAGQAAPSKVAATSKPVAKVPAVKLPDAKVAAAKTPAAKPAAEAARKSPEKAGDKPAGVTSVAKKVAPAERVAAVKRGLASR